MKSLLSIDETPALESPGRAAGRLAGGLSGLVARLDDWSDWLSPIVVKEVRQFVRGREFNVSFFVALLVALMVAFAGAADAAGGSRVSGRWVFTVLTAGLTLLGLVVIPIGAFGALRAERLEQTFDLITVTALSQRRIVIGKLLAQAVKLVTLFAAVAPFIAMSFLLGGIDFGTIVRSLAAVFLASLWACALALFVSSIPKTRAMSGIVFAGIVLVLLFFVGGGRVLTMLLMTITGARGTYFVASYPGPLGGILPGPTAGLRAWVETGTILGLALVSMANLVLLAENRLSSPVEDKATALRAGFLVQFVLIAGGIAASWLVVPLARSIEPFVVLCGMQLALVALFTVTEDLAVSRRVLVQMQAPSAWRWLNPVLRPGGGRGALYVLVQMTLLLILVGQLSGASADVRHVLALCGYVCFFTGVPVVALRYLVPGIGTLPLRGAILVLLAAALILPDLIVYALSPSGQFSLSFTGRHLFNPFRTLVNWPIVEARGWLGVPAVLGVVGLAHYAVLIRTGMVATRRQLDALRPRAHSTDARDSGD